jgi:signal transduction histidine kinase
VISRSLDVMDRQTTHMVRLVDDLLDVNRITRDRLELRRDRISLGDVLRQAIETCAELAERGGHSIDLSLPEAPVYLDADPTRLVQVFGNLLNNACKYSARPGCIRIGVRPAGSSVVVSVADDGIGIPTDSLERIFEMFAQLGHRPVAGESRNRPHTREAPGRAARRQRRSEERRRGLRQLSSS